MVDVGSTVGDVNQTDRREFSIVIKGPFSLQESATFGFGQRLDGNWDGVMRLAFCVDGYHDQVGVEVRQEGASVHCVMVGDADISAVRRQVARVLSLDYDGDEFSQVGPRDPVIARLQAAAPGLRPPQFYSPYEAAAWAVISARRPAQQMAEVRRRLSEAYGRTFRLAGQDLAALPTPVQLLGVGEIAGLNADKVDRLHGVARAALDGRLDVERIRASDPDIAMADLQSIKGIGPFYSALIVIRGSGLADVLPLNEPKMLALVGRLYGLPGPPAEAELRVMAEPWRPFRTWAAVLIRAAAPRVLSAP
jgi:DNA-3-methyladenine glycosylase II